MNQIADMGPFRLVVSKQAEALQYEDLSEQEKADLPQAVSARLKGNEIYRFCLMVKFITLHAPRRICRRRSYDRVDLIIAHVRLPSQRMQLLGIAPVTRPDLPAGGREAEGNLQAEVSIPLIKLTIGGQIRDMIRRQVYDVIAARTDREAQWVFLKRFLQGTTSFCLTLYLDVPDDLPAAERYILCSAEARDNGRSLGRIVDRKVVLPG